MAVVGIQCAFVHWMSDLYLEILGRARENIGNESIILGGVIGLLSIYPEIDSRDACALHDVARTLITRGIDLAPP